MTAEKSDEFYECMLNRQNFSYQIFALKKFRYCLFYGYNLLTWVCQDLSRYVRDMESWNPFIRLPIRRMLLKTRIHLKVRSYPIYLGYIYWRLYHRHRDQLPAVLNANITRVLKQAKRSFTKNCYTKLTPAQRYEIYKFSTFASTL